MRRLFATIAWPLCMMGLVPSAARASAEPSDLIIVRTNDGMLAGVRDQDLAVFKAIPFARPPVGALRWREPQASRPWQGVRPSGDFAPACTQGASAMSLAGQPGSEDCLYLNVWTPAGTGNAADRLPVIVWIHGGGFNFGSTAMPLFNGAALARKGVVFVSASYRLGVFGFLAHPELSRESKHRVSGNYGLLDQIEALRWVRRNIAEFGGDPHRVTIMGESAGATSAGALVQSPLARGLFHGVIAQSGSAFGLPGEDMLTLDAAEREGQAFGETAGAPRLKDLRAMSAEALLRAVPERRDVAAMIRSGPIIDGYVLPADGASLYAAGRFSDTPVLMGNNDDEGSLFPTPGSAIEFTAELVRRFGSDASRMSGLYPANDDAQARASAIAFSGDLTFGVGHLTWARLQAKHGKAPLFYYHFAHHPPARPGVPPGATHGAELPYVFDNQAVRKLAWTDADRVLASQLSTYWTNFAKRGDPNGADLPYWPAFSPDLDSVLYFSGATATVGPVPHGDRLRLIASALDLLRARSLTREQEVSR